MTACNSHPPRFRGRTVLITGAGGDIGTTAARRFSADGCNVVLVDLESARDRLEMLAQELTTDGHAALVAIGDVRERVQVDSTFKRACERFGHVDFVFNNAGVQGPFMPTDSYDEASFRLVMDVNVLGVFLVMQAASTCMKESLQQASHPAVIVNAASLAGVLGPPNMLAYSAAKHAVVGMTRTAAKDLARLGIRVCCIAPGLLEGRMWDNQVQCQAKCRKASETGAALADVTVDDEEIEAQSSRMINGTALKRLGTLDEVVSVVSFLCSDDASYLTGNVITIDGGRFC